MPTLYGNEFFIPLYVTDPSGYTGNRLAPFYTVFLAPSLDQVLPKHFSELSLTCLFSYPMYPYDQWSESTRSTRFKELLLAFKQMGFYVDNLSEHAHLYSYYSIKFASYKVRFLVF